MSAYDVPGALVLIALGFLVWAIHARRDVIRRRKQARARAARNAAALEQHRAARQNLINDTAFTARHGRHGVAYIEDYANGEVDAR